MLKRNEACRGWGFVVNSDHQYEERKDKCYLTFQSGNLCCIYAPDCPSGFVPEIPLKPFRIYDIKNLEIGCVVKSCDQNQKKKKNNESVIVCNHRLFKWHDCLYDICIFLLCCYTLQGFEGVLWKSVVKGSLILMFYWPILTILLIRGNYFMYCACVAYMYGFFHLLLD